MKKILFPTDCSELSRNALDYAIQLAQPMKKKIDIISIFHLPISDASSMPPEYIETMIQERKAEALEKVNHFIKGQEEWIDQIRVDYGIFVATEIYEAANDEPYELIVMGTKGSHNAIEKMMGSVTSQVMMHAPCPVLAIPESAQFKSISRIAYATDFHDNDPEIVFQLLQLNQNIGADLHYVHVDNKGSDEKKDLRTIAGFAAVEHISHNDVIGGLNQYIQEQEIDMLAMYIPKRRLWEKLFHTSFTKKMALHTHVPLLIFREHA